MVTPTSFLRKSGPVKNRTNLTGSYAYDFKYLQEECQMGWVLGPFDLRELPGYMLASLG